ncbi:MAG: carbohydrate kinase [Gammaproteobacteria bacterium]|nr:carbohydrate kinase [Gammaproteobacteria bacterium]
MDDYPITIFGEVLVDRFPDGSAVLGGAPFNVAWHLQAFGVNPLFISRIGTDEAGGQIQAAMQSWGLTTDFIQHDSAYPTGQVQVSFNNGEPAYDIINDQAYDHIETNDIDAINRTSILYHGTLATRSYTSRQSLNVIKILHLGKIFMDVNLRQPWWNRDNVLDIMSYTDCVKLNLDEFDALDSSSGDLHSRMQRFLAKYQLETVIITCGHKGACALLKNGDFFSVTPADLSGKIVDTVGAGDAFSTVTLLGLYYDWEFGLLMERAQTFASEITQRPGAIVDDKMFYARFINDWNLTPEQEV